MRVAAFAAVLLLASPAWANLSRAAPTSSPDSTSTPRWLSAPVTFPELLVDGLQPHKVRQVWLGMSDRVYVRVDIGATLSQKKQALLAHPSQIAEGDVGFIEQWSREAAAGEGCEYAEAFFRIRMDEFPAEEG